MGARPPLHLPRVATAVLFIGLAATFFSWQVAQKLGQGLPKSILIGDLIFSLLVFGVVLALSESRRSAVRLAEDMMADLKRSEATLRGITNAVPGVIYRCRLSADGSQRFLYLSHATRELFGYFAQEIQEDSSVFWKEVFAEDFGPLKKSLQHCARTQQPWTHVFRIRRTDGETRWIHGSAVPEAPQADGAIIWNGILVDVTERFRKEEELKRANEDLVREIAERKAAEAQLNQIVSIVQSTDDAIIGKDLNGLVTSWNPGAQKLFGYRADEIIGKPVSLLYLPSHDEFSKILAAMRQGQMINHYETRRLTKDKRFVDVSVTISPILDSNNNLIGLSTIARDITERKKFEAHLNQAQKMETVGTLAGGLAHDLNNQLTPVIGYLDLIQKRLDASDPAQSLLRSAAQSAQRCADVVQRLLNFSRVSSSSMKSALDTAAVLGEFKAILSRALPITIKIDLRAVPDVRPVLGNETEIQSVLMNLATNARDAMPDGGAVEIEADNFRLEKNEKDGCAAADYVRFTFKDTGAGMTPETLKRIYEPFFTTKQKGKGTGLGLAMVFKTVKDHLGWIEVQSEPGKGSTFRFYLPAADPQKMKKPGSREDSVLPGGRETVLFADDEEVLRGLGKVFLERLGYHVYLAADGEEAVNIYREHHSEIDAVVLDMTMPKLSGKQTFKQILNINPGAKVIIASGYTSEGNPRELLAAGAVQFLQKPFTILPLAQALRNALD